MFIAVHTTDYGEEFWASADTLESVIKELELLVTEEVATGTIQVFEARPVKVSRKVEWQILPD